MVLSRHQMCEIERHFLYATEFDKELEEQRAAIIEAARPVDGASVRAASPGDPTGRAVTALEHATRTLESWAWVVHSTYRHYFGFPEGDLMQAYYTDHCTVGQTCRKLHIVRRTFYRYRTDVLTYAAMKCVERGLMKI